MNATAYIDKARSAEAGVTPAMWTPEEIGVNGDATALYEALEARGDLELFSGARSIN